MQAPRHVLLQLTTTAHWSHTSFSLAHLITPRSKYLTEIQLQHRVQPPFPGWCGSVGTSWRSRSFCWRQQDIASIRGDRKGAAGLGKRRRALKSHRLFKPPGNTAWEATLQRSGGLFAGWLDGARTGVQCFPLPAPRWQGRGGYSFFLLGETRVAIAHLADQIFIQIPGWNHNFCLRHSDLLVPLLIKSSTLSSLWVLLTLWNLSSPQLFPHSIFCASNKVWSGRPGNLQSTLLLILSAKCMMVCKKLRV